jgi:hypothetical protein
MSSVHQTDAQPMLVVATHSTCSMHSRVSRPETELSNSAGLCLWLYVQQVTQCCPQYAIQLVKEKVEASLTELQALTIAFRVDYVSIMGFKGYCFCYFSEDSYEILCMYRLSSHSFNLCR